jgi:hypothetical protein
VEKGQLHNTFIPTNVMDDHKSRVATRVVLSLRRAYGNRRHILHSFSALVGKFCAEEGYVLAYLWERRITSTAAIIRQG